MLTLRAISRPATTLRLGLQSTRRPLHNSYPLFQSQLRPNTLWGKIRFRKDGQPRSRWAGVTFGSLILINGLTLLTMSDLIEDSEVALGLLASIIYIQQADMAFDNVNLDDPISTLEYFKTLYQAFSRVPPEEVDELFKDLTRLMKLGGTSSAAEVEAHGIMRTAAEQVHAAFENLHQESISNVANYVLLVMRDALEKLIDLVQDSEDDDSDSKYTFQLIRDHSKKDPASVLKDYESLG
ncbi:hypothetical protein CPB83DRAFT_358655 [Crepidotus variabilis]|uniref:Uncharacterized protein n=1 Tax=Crepidotus variabilis TaxID=179855 RepID=A0A9P6JQ09_9AGAR|nr:hypothetical protein CPB83DRAFT_358655 [Crepidotus variabilis]